MATSSGEESVNMKLKKYQDLFSCIGHFVMGSSDPEVTHGKPNPDIFLITAKRFRDSPPPEKVLQCYVIFILWLICKQTLFSSVQNIHVVILL